MVRVAFRTAKPALGTETARPSRLDSGGAAVNLNLFNWIREGIRQSVLLGVSDALEEIGTAPQGDELKHHLQTAIGRRP